eukprot:CAMPEP_0172832906 /NCGR_PEP_ID=MMETSP1075-20121228/23991_1 /TAXON_ID=2916 /ORGANISM="Ceratium fusus, Strain PA161109" /LENGTH=273 /DNA_ID=CAMNT_0013675575 /DNA_START=73 /DNA_END=892 /DNA_ORIENTATION=-
MIHPMLKGSSSCTAVAAVLLPGYTFAAAYRSLTSGVPDCLHLLDAVSGTCPGFFFNRPTLSLPSDPSPLPVAGIVGFVAAGVMLQDAALRLPDICNLQLCLRSSTGTGPSRKLLPMSLRRVAFATSAAVLAPLPWPSGPLFLAEAELSPLLIDSSGSESSTTSLVTPPPLDLFPCINVVNVSGQLLQQLFIFSSSTSAPVKSLFVVLDIVAFMGELVLNNNSCWPQLAAPVQSLDVRLAVPCTPMGAMTAAAPRACSTQVLAAPTAATAAAVA